MEYGCHRLRFVFGSKCFCLGSHRVGWKRSERRSKCLKKGQGGMPLRYMPVHWKNIERPRMDGSRSGGAPATRQALLWVVSLGSDAQCSHQT